MLERYDTLSFTPDHRSSLKRLVKQHYDKPGRNNDVVQWTRIHSPNRIKPASVDSNNTHQMKLFWTAFHKASRSGKYLIPNIKYHIPFQTRAGMAARSEEPQETIWVAPTWTCNINVKEDRRWRKAISSVLMSVAEMHNVQFDLLLNELCYRRSVSFLPSVEIMHDH
ncbi:hypothetical protein T05_13309 [Trichinella murrelli]|uniref:Uncharacterized protein n=1 Tax=Trichinella murrelli TaxID=144512 RepID=A0A0V0UC04_9BILA|nr:hypothetical protein T05_13309 [Trichinella murrelli]